MALYLKNVSFIEETRFKEAHAAAMTRAPIKLRHKLHYRIATACWAANHGAKLKGDFVECGVNTGVFSTAVCHYVDFSHLDKRFYLFDTYNGIPPEQVTREEAAKATKYPDCYEDTRRAFEGFPNVQLIRGKVPDTLSSVEIDRVAYLSIDMNIVYPERKAIEYFWPKLSGGAVVLFDDYAFIKHKLQKAALDEFAASVNCTILSLPSGQGLLIKP
jgi:hypothetical protein